MPEFGHVAFVGRVCDDADDDALSNCISCQHSDLSLFAHGVHDGLHDDDGHCSVRYCG